MLKRDVEALARQKAERTLEELVNGLRANSHGAMSYVSVDFTGGDTCKRITVTDAAATTSSAILMTVARPNSTDDSADRGYLYTANVVRRAAGAFDALISCLDIGGMDCTENPPNETIDVFYQVN